MSILKKLYTTMSSWNCEPQGIVGRRKLFSQRRFAEMLAPEYKEKLIWEANTFNNNLEKDFEVLSKYYKERNNSDKIREEISKQIRHVLEWRIESESAEYKRISGSDTLSELKTCMIDALEKTSLHKSNKKNKELISLIAGMSTSYDDKAIDKWINVIYFYCYYAITDDFHEEQAYLSYPLKDDMDEFEKEVTLKYGLSGKPGLYQMYRLANREDNPNLIALYECGEREYYGIGPSKKVNYKNAYNYYERATKCVKDHPLALWSMAYMELDYLQKYDKGISKEYKIPKIETIISNTQYGKDVLCKSIIEKISQAYMYSGPSKAAAANLLGKILELKEEVFPKRFKEEFANRTAGELYKESADAEYVFGCNNFARICYDEYEKLKKKEENKDLGDKEKKLITEKRKKYAAEYIFYLKKAAMLGEPWAANRLAVRILDKWEKSDTMVHHPINSAYMCLVYSEEMCEMDEYYWPLINLCNYFWLNEDERDERRQRLSVSDLDEIVIPKVEAALEKTKNIGQMVQLRRILQKAYRILYNKKTVIKEQKISDNLICKEKRLSTETLGMDEISQILNDEKYNLVSNLSQDTILPSMVTAIGNKNDYKINFCSEGMHKDTLFDLASITKFFLAYIFIVLDENKEFGINIEKTIGEYTTEHFRNLSKFKIRDLLAYNVQLGTEGRIDDFDEVNYIDAYECLEKVRGTYSEEQVYSDMPMLVLGELLYYITGKSFGEWVNELLVFKYDLKNTFWDYSCVPDSLIEKCADYSNELRILGSGRLEKLQCPVGRVHDMKARILSNNGTKLCGNAGLFSSAEDMCIIFKALLNEDEKIKNALFRIVLGNGWDKEAKNNSYGYGCYRKYWRKDQNEVPILMSPYTIVASGFTGCFFALDLLNEVYIFIGANRISGYISRIDAYNLKDRETDDYIVVGDKKYKSSVRYVYRRDKIRDSLSIEVLRTNCL